MSDLRTIIEHSLLELAAHVVQGDEHFVLPGDAALVANHVATSIEDSGVLAAPADPNQMQVDAVITKPTVTANVKASFNIADALKAVFSEPGKPQQ